MRTLRLYVSLIGCAVAFFFFAQYTMAFLEGAGLVECHDSCDRDVSSTPSSETGKDHCTVSCGCHVMSYVFERPPFLLDLTFENKFVFSSLTENAPDGPVFGIDYPPQIAT